MFIKFKKQDNQSETYSDIENLPIVVDPTASADKLDNGAVVMVRPTIISEGSSLDGNLTFEGLVHLDGKFKGNLKADKVVVGKNGLFSGNLVANSVTISGQIKGDVTCQSIGIKNGSKIVAKIQYEVIEMQAGTVISGELICVKK
jgi:cytoskeletal protein CcmA (bactofilin family)